MPPYQQQNCFPSIDICKFSASSCPSKAQTGLCVAYPFPRRLILSYGMTSRIAWNSDVLKSLALSRRCSTCSGFSVLRLIRLAIMTVFRLEALGAALSHSICFRGSSVLAASNKPLLQPAPVLRLIHSWPLSLDLPLLLAGSVSTTLPATPACILISSANKQRDWRETGSSKNSHIANFQPHPFAIRPPSFNDVAGIGLEQDYAESNQARVTYISSLASRFVPIEILDRIFSNLIFAIFASCNAVAWQPTFWFLGRRWVDGKWKI